MTHYIMDVYDWKLLQRVSGYLTAIWPLWSSLVYTHSYTHFCLLTDQERVLPGGHQQHPELGRRAGHLRRARDGPDHERDEAGVPGAGLTVPSALTAARHFCAL